MDKPKIFRVVYQTAYSKGRIRVYVGNFFGNSTLRNIDKLLRLEKAHCTSEQQAQLLMDLEEEKLMSWSTKRNHLEKCIKRVKAQTWGKTC